MIKLVQSIRSREQVIVVLAILATILFSIHNYRNPKSDIIRVESIKQQTLINIKQNLSAKRLVVWGYAHESFYVVWDSWDQDNGSKGANLVSFGEFARIKRALFDGDCVSIVVGNPAVIDNANKEDYAKKIILPNTDVREQEQLKESIQDAREGEFIGYCPIFTDFHAGLFGAVSASTSAIPEVDQQDEWLTVLWQTGRYVVKRWN